MQSHHPTSAPLCALRPTVLRIDVREGLLPSLRVYRNGHPLASRYELAIVHILRERDALPLCRVTVAIHERVGANVATLANWIAEALDGRAPELGR